VADLARLQRQRAQSFVMRRARSARGPVLDLYCGAGELCQTLAVAGIETLGVEPLARPAQLATLAGVRRLELLGADPRALVLSRRFGLVLAVGGALRRPEVARSLDALFRAAARHLGRDGTFIAETAALARRFPSREPGPLDPRTGAVRAVRADSRARKSLRVPHLLSRGQTTPLPALRLAPELVLQSLRDAGLEPLETYGDFDERPFDADSPRLICVARRARR
jgi:hypothetical protein